MKPLHFVLFSGGYDTSSLIAWLIAEKKVRKEDILAIQYKYGSTIDSIEERRGRQIARIFDVSYTIRALSMLKGNTVLNRKNKGKKVRVWKGFKNDYVPFRNPLMIFHAANYLLSVKKFGTIYYGPCADDQHQDTSLKHHDFAKEIVKFCSLGKLELKAPFIKKHKKDYLKYLQKPEFKGVLELTYSCMSGRAKHCGRCRACVTKRRALGNSFTI